MTAAGGTSGGPVRLFVIDDRPLQRAGVRSTLHGAGSVQIVGEASAADEAVSALEVLDPPADVVLLDGQLDGDGAVTVLDRLAGWAERRPRVIVLDSRPTDDGLVAAAFRAGVKGYLTTAASPEELTQTIQLVADGGVVLGQGVELTHVLTSAARQATLRSLPYLTDRERQVLDLVARGYDNRRIARSLTLSEKTVRNHVSRVFAKLNVGKRVEAAIHAREAGLGQ